jgi:DNA polymerase-1
MSFHSQPFDMQALMPKDADNYWLITWDAKNAQELRSDNLPPLLARAPSLWVCADAKSLINKHVIKARPDLYLFCLSSIKKLLHKNNINAELDLPVFHNVQEARLWTEQAVNSALEKIKERDISSLVALECQVISATAAMEQAGLAFNSQLWEHHLADLKHEHELLKKKLEPYFQKNSGFALFGPNLIDLQSSNEVKARLEELLNTKLLSTSQSSLKNYDHEAVKLLINYREHSRMISTYGESFLNYIKNNRIHASFVPLGSASGRFACHEPNLLALPKNANFQACLKPPAPRRLMYCDYGAFELRILAGLSDEKALMSIFNDNLDIHSMVAEAVFGIEVSKTQNSHLRAQAKLLNFGLIYGMGEHALSKQLAISLSEAQTLMKNYFKRFPKVLELLESLEKKALNDGFVNTSLGRRLYFLSDRNPNARARVARNVPIQGTGADIAKLALCKAFKYLYTNNLDAQIVNIVHDELVIECHDDDYVASSALVHKAMTEAFLTILPKVKPEIEISSSN